MSMLFEVEAASYPPDPESWDDAVTMGITLREAGDTYGRWVLGWLADAVCRKAEYGDAALPKLAAAIGVKAGWLKQNRWVASRFTPQEVRMFPRLSFGFFRAVARVAETDKEIAFELLEKADDNGWRIEDLEAEVRGGPSEPITAPPVIVEGSLSVMTMRPIMVKTDDGEALLGYLAIPLETPHPAEADRIYAKIRGPKPPATRDMTLAHEEHLVMGVRLPVKGADEWRAAVQEQGLTDDFVRQTLVRPI